MGKKAAIVYQPCHGYHNGTRSRVNRVVEEISPTRKNAEMLRPHFFQQVGASSQYPLGISLSRGVP
jgi:hypothetical protein